MARQNTSTHGFRIAPLSDEHCRQIEAALPHGADRGSALKAIDETMRRFLSSRERRSRHPPGRRRALFERILNRISGLAADVRRLKRETLWSDPVPNWPASVLDELWNLKELTETLLEEEKVLHLAVRGRRDEYKELLYSGILRVWLSAGGELRHSTPPEGGPPRGPCVRFFLVVVEPILGDDTPSPYGVAKIIKRHDDRRSIARKSGRPKNGILTGQN